LASSFGGPRRLRWNFVEGKRRHSHPPPRKRRTQRTLAADGPSDSSDGRRPRLSPDEAGAIHSSMERTPQQPFEMLIASMTHSLAGRRNPQATFVASRRSIVLRIPYLNSPPPSRPAFCRPILNQLDRRIRRRGRYHWPSLSQHLSSWQPVGNGIVREQMIESLWLELPPREKSTVSAARTCWCVHHHRHSPDHELFVARAMLRAVKLAPSPRKLCPSFEHTDPAPAASVPPAWRNSLRPRIAMAQSSSRRAQQGHARRSAKEKGPETRALPLRSSNPRPRPPSTAAISPGFEIF